MRCLKRLSEEVLPKVRDRLEGRRRFEAAAE
jgi:hypothetical protein